MVYRLYRASRFRMARIFIVLLIYSIIIGSIGFVLLGVVVSFDTQSFNPSLYDANAPNAGTNLVDGKICENYKGETCNWYLYNDLQTRPLYDKYLPELNLLRDRVDMQNLLMLRDKQNGTYFVSSTASVDSFVFNQTIAQIPYLSMNGNSTCFSLLKGSSCSSFYYNSSSTVLPNETFQLLPKLHIYSFGGLNPSNPALGSSVLIDNNTNQILCDNFPQNCTYNKVAPSKYQYFDSNLQTKVNITATQAIIFPYAQITRTDGISDADRGTTPQVMCQNEINNTYSCQNPNAPLIEYPNYFVFIDGLNHIRVGTIALSQLSYPGVKNDVLDLNNYNSVQNQFGCSTITNSNGLAQLMNQININCYISADFQTSNLVNEPFPLNGRDNPTAPKLLFSLEPDAIHVKIGLLISSTEGKSTPAILLNIISRPALLLRNIVTNDLTTEVLLVAIISFIINLLLALILIFIRFWKRVGGFLAPKSTLTLRGKIGALLELTQFFQFGGSWYLEAQSVNDYNFNSTMGVVHELVRERWRDTIFFPTSLAASISIVIFSLYSDPISILSLFVIGGLLPILLAFWTPTLWIIQDSGLKRAEWDDRGELLTIQKISDIIRDGFNKLVGFSAIFGLGTAGATVIRAQITGSSVSTSSALTGGFESLINLNFNFLASAILWTVALLFIVTAVSLSGNVITSLSYLNTDHLANVKKMRTKLQQKEIFLGTTQPSMDHANRDTSVYFDSKQGIDSVLDQQSKRGSALPENTIIAKQAFKNEEDLTQIIIADPKDFENEPKKSDQTTSSESSTEEESDSEGESTVSTEQQSTDDSDTNDGNSSDESTWFDEDTSSSDSSDSEFKKDE